MDALSQQSCSVDPFQSFPQQTGSTTFRPSAERPFARVLLLFQSPLARAGPGFTSCGERRLLRELRNSLNIVWAALRTLWIGAHRSIASIDSRAVGPEPGSSRGLGRITIQYDLRRHALFRYQSLPLRRGSIDPGASRRCVLPMPILCRLRFCARVIQCAYPISGRLTLPGLPDEQWWQLTKLSV
jgi:hypothetical protein